jgi:hypothetical protein
MSEPEALLSSLPARAPFDPTPVGDLARRASRRRRIRSAALAGGLAAAVIVSVVSVVSASSGPGHRKVVVPAGPPPTSSASRLGPVAYVTAGSLDIREPDGRVVSVPLPTGGVPSELAWSPDGRWMSFLLTPKPPAGAPFDVQPPQLWVAAATGSPIREISSAGQNVGATAWRPGSAETIAFDSNADNSNRSELYVATVGSAPHVVTSGRFISSFVWSPDGMTLAVAAAVAGRNGSAPTDEILLLPISGGPPKVAATTKGNGYILDSFWPDGHGLLYWLDYDNSASIAADGLPLMSLDLSTGASRPLATTLVHPDWVKWSPSGDSVAIVSGGDRIIWDLPRQPEICQVVSGVCRALYTPTGAVSLDPVWTAGGTVLYTSAPGATAGQLAPPGVGPPPDFAAGPVEQWYSLQSIRSDGSVEIPHAHNPLAVPAGLLYISEDALWLRPATGGPDVELATSIGPPAPYSASYYAYIDWSSEYAVYLNDRT